MATIIATATTIIFSWNCGVEGPTEDPQINAFALIGSAGNILTTLFLSQGVPMLCGGDELGGNPERK